MSLLFLVAAVFSFLLEALSPVFEWDLGEFNAIAWGLTALATSFVLGSPGFAAWRSRV